MSFSTRAVREYPAYCLVLARSSDIRCVIVSMQGQDLQCFEFTTKLIEMSAVFIFEEYAVIEK